MSPLVEILNILESSYLTLYHFYELQVNVTTATVLSRINLENLIVCGKLWNFKWR